MADLEARSVASNLASIQRHRPRPINRLHGLNSLKREPSHPQDRSVRRNSEKSPRNYLAQIRRVAISRDTRVRGACLVIRRARLTSLRDRAAAAESNAPTGRGPPGDRCPIVLLFDCHSKDFRSPYAFRDSSAESAAHGPGCPTAAFEPRLLLGERLQDLRRRRQGMPADARRMRECG